MSHAEPLNLRAGELVEVLSEHEILATLDENGALDGLPFMPEMLALCGQRLRVDKRADKACDTIHYSGNRRMYDTVLLDGGRCDGQAHGGCQARCLLFWKEAWLRRVGTRPAAPGGDAAPGELAAGRPSGPVCDRTRLVQATRAAEQPGDDGPRYRCQATDLLLATSPMTWWDPRQYARDVTSGNVRVREVVGAALFRVFVQLLRLRGYRLLVWSYNKVQSWRGGRPFPFPLDGMLDKTPRATLDLKPGELVRVKSKEEILKTLNKRNRNHGLSFDREMVRYCGNVYRVLSRVERIIEEPSGKMITLSNDCIILDGVICRAEYSDKRLFCPRSLYPFWREIWLERMSAADATSPRGASECLSVGGRGECAGRR
jgi:hypothetical protein